MNLRPATSEDVFAIEQLLKVVWMDDEAARTYFSPNFERDTAIVAFEAKRLIGVASLQRRLLHPTRDYLGVHVHPDFRARGIGAQLYTALLPLMQSRAKPLQTATSQEFVSAQHWLERRGFHVVMRTFSPRFLPTQSQLEAWKVGAHALEGVEFTTLATHPDWADRVARAHHLLYTQTHPWNPPAAQSLETLRRVYLGDDLIPEAMFLAVRAEHLLGLASLRCTEENESLELAWFGAFDQVIERREIVLGVLAACWEYAIAQDAALTGEFDSLNPDAMLALDALGIDRGSAWLTLQRDAIVLESRLAS